MSNETPEPEVAAVEVSTESIWDQPAVVSTSADPSASGNSIVALVLSITSWVVCPIVFAIVALVFAHKAEKEILASNGAVGGGAFVMASKIVAWINIGVYSAVVVLGIIGLFLLTILGVSSS
jgi:hypothetical protein